MARCTTILTLLLLGACATVPEGGDSSISPIRTAPGEASPLTRTYQEEVPEAVPPPGEYDLTGILELVEKSPELIALEEVIARESGAVRQGSFAPNPVLNLETDMMPIDDMGFGNAKNKIGVSQRIEVAGKAQARVDRAMAAKEEAIAHYYHMRAEFQTEVAKDFYRALFARRRVESTARTLELKKDLLEKAEGLHGVGRISDRELIAHQVAVQKTAAERKKYEAEEQRLLRGLEGRLGLEAGTIKALKGDAPGWTASSVDGTKEREAILSRNSELILLDRKVDRARADLKAEESRAYSDVTVGVKYIRGSEGTRERDDFVSGFLEIPFPVIDRNQGGIQSARAAIRKAESELKAAAYRLLDEWSGLFEEGRLVEDQRDLYNDKIIPLLERDRDFRGAQVEIGRLPIQRRLEAAVELEEAVLTALSMDEMLAMITARMRFLTGGVH